jgi:hypothetical protein
MTKEDEWAFRAIRRFEKTREEQGEPTTFPGYWANCILNYVDHLRLVWC